MSNTPEGQGRSSSDDFSIPTSYLHQTPQTNSTGPVDDGFRIPDEYLQDSDPVNHQKTNSMGPDSEAFRIPDEYFQGSNQVGQSGGATDLSVAVLAENLSYFSAANAQELLDISFQIHKGKLSAILGGNENGASALLRLLALEKKPTQGRLIIQSRDIVMLGDLERLSWASSHIVTIRRKHLELFTQTGYLHVSYWLHYYRGFEWNDAKETARQALLDVGLADVKHALPIGSLSLAEKARVSIAKAYVSGKRHASIYLCDDIFGGVDKPTAIELLQILREVAKRDIAVIIVAHRPDLQADFDHVLVLQDKRLARNS